MRLRGRGGDVPSHLVTMFANDTRKLQRQGWVGCPQGQKGRVAPWPPACYCVRDWMPSALGESPQAWLWLLFGDSCFQVLIETVPFLCNSLTSEDLPSTVLDSLSVKFMGTAVLTVGAVLPCGAGEQMGVM